MSSAFVYQELWPRGWFTLDALYADINVNPISGITGEFRGVGLQGVGYDVGSKAVVLNLFWANATTPATPAMPLEQMNERPANHGHRGLGNADSTKTDRTQRPNKAYIFCIWNATVFSWRLRSEQLELNKRKEENGLFFASPCLIVSCWLLNC